MAKLENRWETELHSLARSLINKANTSHGDTRKEMKVSIINEVKMKLPERYTFANNKKLYHCLLGVYSGVSNIVLPRYKWFMTVEMANLAWELKEGPASFCPCVYWHVALANSHTSYDRQHQLN